MASELVAGGTFSAPAGALCDCVSNPRSVAHLEYALRSLRQRKLSYVAQSMGSSLAASVLSAAAPRPARPPSSFASPTTLPPALPPPAHASRPEQHLHHEPQVEQRLKHPAPIAGPTCSSPIGQVGVSAAALLRRRPHERGDPVRGHEMPTASQSLRRGGAGTRARTATARREAGAKPRRRRRRTLLPSRGEPPGFPAARPGAAPGRAPRRRSSRSARPRRESRDERRARAAASDSASLGSSAVILSGPAF